MVDPDNIVVREKLEEDIIGEVEMKVSLTDGYELPEKEIELSEELISKVRFKPGITVDSDVTFVSPSGGLLDHSVQDVSPGSRTKVYELEEPNEVEYMLIEINSVAPPSHMLPEDLSNPNEEITLSDVIDEVPSENLPDEIRVDVSIGLVTPELVLSEWVE